MKIKRRTLTPMLMILSQLLLAGFVAYWLASQYREERKFLGEDVARFYDQARSQVIDSLVFNRVVEPALRDSLVLTFAVGDTANSRLPQKIKGSRANAIYTRCDTTVSGVYTVTAPDSLSGERGDGKILKVMKKKPDVLIRSIKLLISHSKDSAGQDTAVGEMLPGTPDTALFRKVLLDHLTGRYPSLRVVWIPDPIQSASRDTVQKAKQVEIISHSNSFSTGNISVIATGHIDSKPGPDILPHAGVLKVQKADVTDSIIKGRIHVSSLLPDGLPGVVISHEFPYLAGRIIPQILFGLILLLLTGSAFFFTNRSLKRQLMLNSLRNDFVSNITHELKTPVSTVKVALEALKTFDKVHNPEITQEYLEMAGQEMNRLDQLIGKVLDQSLIGEQQEIALAQPTDLKRLVETVIQRLQPRLAAHQALVELDAVEAETLLLDPLLVEGVLNNLIDNSLKYGGEKTRIRIRLKKNDREAILEVSDNGPGIPTEYLERVFDRFFRVPAGDTHNTKGYGLGLSYAAMVMKQHGGSITAGNLREGGCIFTLRFPLKKP